jgi:hypothetical protein
MKLNELRKIIREEVKAAIQEELKDILLEAVKSPKSVISTPEPSFQSSPSNLQEQRNARMDIMNKMMARNGNMNLNSSDVNTFRPTGGDTVSEGSSLPAGNVGLDQIMGLMNSK